MTAFTSHRANRFINGIIIANTVVLIWSLFDHIHEEILEPIHTGFLIVFVIEVTVRWVLGKYGWWLIFDTAVILLGLLPIVGADATVLRVARTARVIHSLRHVMHLRIFDLLKRKGTAHA